jgi:3-methylfumaryl-CoA hydratase
VDPLLLFRFSALTFNSHRIHYDLDYARDVEGYPDLVAQGPLLAVLLAELGHSDGSIPSEFTFRAHSPAFARDTISLEGSPENGTIDLSARTERGLAANARVTLPGGSQG